MLACEQPGILTRSDGRGEGDPNACIFIDTKVYIYSYSRMSEVFEVTLLSSRVVFVFCPVLFVDPVTISYYIETSRW